MSTDIATLQANKALAMLGDSIDDIAAAIEESQVAVQQQQAELPSFVNFAKFTQPAEMGPVSPWQYGREDEERQIRPDSEWVVDFNSIEWGWSGYKKTNGLTGDMIKGQKPDQLLVKYLNTPPAKDPKLPWASSFTVKFRAMCVKEGSAETDEVTESKGDVIEVTVHQATQQGFVEMVNAVRGRILAFTNAKKTGNTKLMAELGSTMYPLVAFEAKLKVKVKSYTVNKPILKHLGWTAPVALMGDEAPDAGPETPKEDLSEAIDAAQAEPEAPAAKGRRSRTK